MLGPKELSRDYSVMVSNFGCMVSCYVQLANSRAPVLAHNALALFPRGSLQVIYTASVDHTTAPTPKVCERSMASTTRALIAHPACSTSLQEVYVPWSIWSRLYITSNVAKTELLDELTLGLEFQDVVILLSMPTFYVGVLILLPIVESVFDKHRESIPFSCSVAIAVLALFIGYLAEWSLDFALDNIADPFPIISIALAGGSTALDVYFRPYLIEVIFAALILAVSAIALQAKNLMLGCGALLIVALLQIFGAANPSTSKVVMLLSCLLAFTDTSSSEAKPHIAEIYAIFAATTDVQALANLAILYGSEEVSISFARVPMVVTGSVACFARYFIHFCLLASLHDTSYYSVTTSAAGQAPLQVTQGEPTVVRLSRTAHFLLPTVIDQQAERLRTARQAAAQGMLSSYAIPLLADTQTLHNKGKSSFYCPRPLNALPTVAFPPYRSKQDPAVNKRLKGLYIMPLPLAIPISPAHTSLTLLFSRSRIQLLNNGKFAK